jgi:hypothetical protein
MNMSKPWVYEFDVETDGLSIETMIEVVRKIAGVISVGLVRAQTETSWPVISVVVGGKDFQEAQDALTEMFAQDAEYEKGLGLFEVTG